MNYPSIRIEGGILSPDILDCIEDADGQKPAHFELDSTAKVKDEILRVWADAQDLWRIFQRKLESLKADSPATTETRNLWIVPLLSLLGYQLEYQARGTEVNGKNYPISHRVTNRRQTALHIIGYREPSGLDRKPEKMALRMSAHAMVQEYLNLSEQLHGIVTNGRVLRVLRDSSRLVKLSYLELDLDRIFTDGLFADFAVLFRLLHATRLPKNEESTASCWLERYHQKSIDEGTRIRDGLRDAVTEALEVLGTGFLPHPDNTALRQQVSSGELQPETYFSHLLRLVYRLLFIMVVEERGLLFPKDVSPKNVALYFRHYSVQRLRRLAVTRGLKVERFSDAWLSLLATFKLFENPAQAAKLGTTVFGGQLFNPESLGPLTACRLSNAALFSALDSLCNFNHPETKQRTPVNFGALATEEFGSIYESLLELRPVVEIEPTPHFGFQQVAGNERKTTGSYYTPTSLVTCLLDSALDPVLEDRIQNFKALGFKSVDEAVLALNVCDPACGSGHFLIAAAHRIARRLALLRAKDEEPSPELLRHTFREVIGNCIHGVDVNPMSVELCKVALWLEAVEPGKPLNFLDHHIKCGNSLLGATPECIRDGIPDKAYEPITGDNKEAAKWMRQLNKEAREGQVHFDFTKAMPWERLGNLPAAIAKLETLDDETPEALLGKEKLYHEIVEGSGYEHARLLYDTWCAGFVWPKESREYGSELTTEHLRNIERNPHSILPGLKAKVRELSQQYRFFHWHLEFPAVFASENRGGFDVILGNPPWDMVELSEKEFFASRAKYISEAKTAKQRQELIRSLAVENPKLFGEFTSAKRIVYATRHFVQNSGRFPYSSMGRINLYPLFAENTARLVGPKGRGGIVVPSAISMDAYNAPLFKWLLEGMRLVSLYDFDNTAGLFPDVDSRYRFCLLTVTGGSSAVQRFDFCFYTHDPSELRSRERIVSLSLDQISTFSPNTLAPPMFQSIQDADLAARAYGRFGVLVNSQTFQNSWNISIQRMLSLSDPGDLFRRIAELPAQDLQASGAWVRLHSGKAIHQFEHRYATFEREDWRVVEQREQKDPDFEIRTEYYTRHGEVSKRLAGKYPNKWLLVYRDVTNATNERTTIAAIIPASGCDTTCRNIYSRSRPVNLACFLSCVNSFAFDYFARQKVIGMHLGAGVVEQLPAAIAETYAQGCIWSSNGQTLAYWLLPRVLELTYTAWDLEAFARDCDFDGPPFRWDEKRRSQLRCELDAAFFHVYLGTEEEWHRQPESLTKHFPTPRDAVAYIMDTFPIVKRKDEKNFGTYRTRDTILALYDDLAESQRTGRPFVSPLDPPPADPRCCHPPRKQGHP